MNELAIQQSVCGPMRELALFAGAGGGILGGKLLGWRTVCAVERNAYCAAILAQRQNEGYLEPFPIWSDVETFDGRPWRGIVDIVSGGFPCQDISTAGKGAGLEGERSGLWKEMARIIGEVRPAYAFVENSPSLTGRGLDRVLGDFSEMGYDCRWGIVSAADAIWAMCDPCIDHERDRIWIVAKSADVDCSWKLQPKRRFEKQWGRPAHFSHKANSHISEIRLEQMEQQNSRRTKSEGSVREARKRCVGRQRSAGWWSAEPDVVRVVHGVPYRMDRIGGLGNAQIPAVAALAWRLLTDD